MKRAIYTVSAAGLALLLAGFGPPELPRERAQQDTWKTWIPEPKRKEPIIAAPDLPSDETHASPALTCKRVISVFNSKKAEQQQTVPSRSEQEDKQFTTDFAALFKASREERSADVVKLAERAARLAVTPDEWTQIEQVRFRAYLDLKDKFRALKAVDALLSLGCQSELMMTTYQNIHADLRQQMGLPPG
ncbi:MAG TPA: hypothetical protein VG942_09605 [Hyphomonadaceae bacterium]|nr:hypothetical protein [Hyphomonadaceae bacterium]